MFSLPRIALRMATTLTGLSLAMALAPAVIAAPPTIPTLNPEAPDFYTCSPVGGGTVCRALTTDVYGPEPTGIFCGTGAQAFEVLDTATRVVRATRYYDADGNLVRRRRVVDFIDPHFTNPQTGAVLPYRQYNPDWEEFTIPGDLSSAVYHGHGFIQFTVPGLGSVMHEAGVTVVSPDGEVVHEGGPRDFADYFAGDSAVIADLCTALGG